LSKASNTCRAAALGSSGMIITSRYQVLVYQRHTPKLGLPNFLHI
jgi:hypothetical protein